MEWLFTWQTGAAAVILLAALTMILMQTITIRRLQENRDEMTEQIDQLSRDVQELAATCAVITENQRGSMENISMMLQVLREDQRGYAELQSSTLSGMLRHQQTSVTSQITQLEQRMAQTENTLNQRIQDLQTENHRQLDEIRGTVDEKLQTTLEKRITESFRLVSEQLENVYKGLGDMQSLAGDVGSLKKVLTGVKTRGILGEVQLDAILKELLAPSQYDTNIPTIPGSTNRVEFAVKLPNTDDSFIYLPIDSKFPGDTYSALLDAQETGDKASVEKAWKKL